MSKDNRWWTFAVVSLALFMGMLDNLVVTTALPTIQRAIGASVANLEWIVNAYTLCFAVLMIPAAKAAGLGDVKVTWSTFRSSDVMNDALLSGNLDFASVGGPGLATIWAKTRGTTAEVKACRPADKPPTMD